MIPEKRMPWSRESKKAKSSRTHSSVKTTSNATSRSSANALRHNWRGEPVRKEHYMKNSLTVAFCNLLLLTGSFAIDANAQAAVAQAHVAAAKAAVAPKAGNGQPWHVYQNLFN